MLDLLTIQSGRKINWRRVNKLCSTLLIEHNEKLPLPHWLTPPILERMVELKTRAWSWFNHLEAISLETRKLLIGVFLNDLAGKMENLKNEADTKKLNLYETVGVSASDHEILLICNKIFHSTII